MTNMVGYMGMKLTCPVLFLEGPHWNANWESRENIPLSKGATQKVPWFQLLSQRHWPLYSVVLCLESTARAQCSCLSSSYWACRLASHVILDIIFYLPVSFWLTGHIPTPLHISLHLSVGEETLKFVSFKVYFFSLLWLFSYSELLRFVVNLFVQSALPSKTWEDEWEPC